MQKEPQPYKHLLCASDDTGWGFFRMRATRPNGNVFRAGPELADMAVSAGPLRWFWSSCNGELF